MRRDKPCSIQWEVISYGLTETHQKLRGQREENNTYNLFSRLSVPVPSDAKWKLLILIGLLSVADWLLPLWKLYSIQIARFNVLIACGIRTKHHDVLKRGRIGHDFFQQWHTKKPKLSDLIFYQTTRLTPTWIDDYNLLHLHKLCFRLIFVADRTL